MNKVHKGLFFITSNEVIWPKKKLNFMYSLWKYSLGTTKFGHSFPDLYDHQNILFSHLNRPSPPGTFHVLIGKFAYSITH